MAKHPTAWAILALLLAGAACGGGRGAPNRGGAVAGHVRAFAGGPAEPAVVPLAPFPVLVQVRRTGAGTVAQHEVLPGATFRFPLRAGTYTLVARLADTADTHFYSCAEVPVTVHPDRVTDVDVRCSGSAG